MNMFLLLIFAHFLADYPLQGDFLSRAKNRMSPILGVPFWQPMTAHAAIHGGFVGIITGSAYLAVAETVIHWITDDAKCRGWIGYNTDQMIHIACKFVWVVIFMAIGGEA